MIASTTTTIDVMTMIRERRRRMRTISRRSTAPNSDSPDGLPWVTGSVATEGELELGRDIYSDLVLVVAKERNVAFALNILVPKRHRAESVEEVFYFPEGRVDVVPAQLVKELVVLIGAPDRKDDITSKFIVEPERKRISAYPGSVGLGGLGDDLFGFELDVDQPRRTPSDECPVFEAFIRSDAGCVEPLARISDAEFTGDQVGELDVDPAEHAITIGMQWLCRNAADITLIHVERGENAQLGPERRAQERIVESTMPDINLAVAIALINDGAILGDGRPIVIGIDACPEGCNQTIELLPVADVSRYQRI